MTVPHRALESTRLKKLCFTRRYASRHLATISLVASLVLLMSAFAACARPTPLPFPIATRIATEIPAEALPSPTAEVSPTPSATLTAAATSTPAPTPTAFITPPHAVESVNIPVLMYHHLKYREPNASETLKTWSVAPDQFAAQLDYLQGRGFHTITFKQLVAFFENGAPLPTNPILLTFDDGWIDAYTVAFPELKQRGMVGNFFVPTRYADAGGELLVNWEQILEMDRAGMEFGGHTISHADLTKITLEEMRRELRDSKTKIEDKLGHPIYALSYPFGAFNPKVMAETQAAGYRAALILCCGYKQSADILFALPRIRVSYDDTLDDLASKLPP